MSKESIRAVLNNEREVWPFLLLSIPYVFIQRIVLPVQGVVTPNHLLRLHPLLRLSPNASSHTNLEGH
jgi:hypothetical protein